MNADTHYGKGGTHAPRERVRVVLTGSCDGLAELRESLEAHPEIELPGWCEDVRYAAGMLTAGQPTAVLHATRGPSLPAGELAAIREHTPAPIIVLASGDASTLLEQALEADVADVLVMPQFADNVVFAVRKARQHQRRPVETVEERPSRRGRIVTVFAPKGGTGKSVVSTNLAAAFAKFEDRPTLLLDLDLQFGDAAIMLGAEPEKTIYDLVAAPGELDSEKLAGYTMHHGSGLDVLAAPLRPEDAELVTEPKINRLLEVARESYDLIVVDTSPFFHGPMLATLDQTDELLLLCGLDVPTLKNVRLSMQTLGLLSFPSDRIRLVLNQASPKRGLKRSEIESALHVKVAFEIPYDADVPEAVNRGKPPVLNGSARFSSAIRQMSAALGPSEESRSRSRSLVTVPRRAEAVRRGRGRWPALGRA